MKKFLAFALSIVLLFSVFAFVACKSDEPQGEIKGRYKEVNLANEQERKEFVQTLVAQIDEDKLIGNIEADNWSFGLEEKYSTNLEFDLKAVVGADSGKSDTYAVNGKLNVRQLAKISLKTNNTNTFPVDFAASISASVKGNVNLPDVIYQNMEDAELVRSLISDFDYSLDAYVDNQNAFVSLPEKLVNLLPEGTLPSNKLKLPISSIFGGSAPSPFALSTEDEILGELDFELEELIADFVDMCVEYKISVAVSKTNGYAVRLTADKQTVLAILRAEEELPENIISVIDYNLGNNFKAEVYFAINKDGSFKQISANLSLDTTIALSGDAFDIPDTDISGTVKLNYAFDLLRFDGKIDQPKDADSYYDLSELL